MDEKRILEQFKALNPFKDSVVKNPLENEIIDVKVINKDGTLDNIIPH